MTLQNFHIEFKFIECKLCSVSGKKLRRRVHLRGHFAVVYPAQRGKVCRLRTVEAMIEASVIPIREGDHELPRFLSNLK